MKDDITIKKIINLIIIVFAIIFIVGIAMHNVTKDNTKVKVKNINDGWVLKTSKSKIEDIKITEYQCSRDDYKSLDLEYRFPKDYKIIFPTIFIQTDNIIENARIGNKIIEWGENKEKYKYYEINLPNDYKGKVLKLHIKLEKNEKSNILNSVEFMSDSDYVLYNFRKNSLPFLVAISIGILGGLLILVVVVVPKKTQRMKKLFWTGITFLCGCIAMIAYYEIYELLDNNRNIVKNMLFTGVFLIIPSVLMIAYNTFRNKKYKKIMYGYNIVLYLMYLLLVCLYFTKTISYEKIMFYTQIVIIVTSVLLLIYNIFSYVKVNIMEKVYTLGMSVCYILVVFLVGSNMLSENFSKSNIKTTIIIALIGCFFITTIVYYAYVVEGYLDKVTENRILSTIVYTDPLTGIMNRTKYEEIVEEIEKESKESIIVYSFDLNNLKKVNDKYGHEMGDMYIKGFANSLKEIFESIGFVGRLGGDEFTVILENSDIDNGIDKLQRCFSKYMKEYNIDYEASFAYGIADSRLENVSIKDLINLADDRMYEYKKQQKITR